MLAVRKFHYDIPPRNAAGNFAFEVSPCCVSPLYELLNFPSVQLFAGDPHVLFEHVFARWFAIFRPLSGSVTRGLNSP